LEGNVEALLVDALRPQWGTYDRQTGQLDLHDKRRLRKPQAASA
jgi:hypothetical protein